MIEHCEREQFVHAKAGEATSGPLEGFDRNLVAILKHLLFYRPLSPMVLLLGGLIIFSPLIEGGTTQLPVLIMRLILLGALIVWVTYRMKLGGIVLIRSRLIPVLVLFLGWAGLSLWWAPYKNPSVQWFISLLMYAVLFGVVLQGIRVNDRYGKSPSSWWEWDSVKGCWASFSTSGSVKPGQRAHSLIQTSS